MPELRPTDDEGRDDVGGAPVEIVPGPVIARRRSRVGVAGEYLHIPRRAILNIDWLTPHIIPPETGSEVHQYDGPRCAR